MDCWRERVRTGGLGGTTKSRTFWEAEPGGFGEREGWGKGSGREITVGQCRVCESSQL